MENKKRIVALGFFDGVHVGHAALLERAKARAAERNAVPAVLSFDTHPDTLVRGERVALITSPEDRAEIINRVFGIDSVIFIHFNQELMHMPWRDFIEKLTRELSVSGYVVGYDFRFGWRGEGNGELLSRYCAENGMSCDVIPAVSLDGGVVSSTRIRSLIANGDMERANRLLGHPHSLTDKVRYGFQLGAKLGTPTINMCFAPGVEIPRHGVYAAKVFLDGGGEYLAVTNVGVRPTVSGDDHVSVESFILDFSGDLYSHRVRVEFHKFLRDERRFDSVESLRAEILKNAQETREYFSTPASL